MGLLILIASMALGQSSGPEPGQTPRPKSEPPVLPSEEESVRLDKKMRQFYAVRDDAPFRYRGKEMGGVPEVNAANDELEAYNYTIEFASRKDPALLRKYSDKKVPWGNLYGEIRHDYLRELLHFEGKMVFLAPFKPTDSLVAAGITTLYEAWLYPTGSPELICLVVTELPKGVEPGENLNVWVSFDAYYFKYMQYQSRQEKPKEKQAAGADKQQWRRAPLFIGRTFEKLDYTEPEVAFFSGGMFYGVLGALLVLIAVGAALSFWFRRGDRAIKAASQRRIQDSIQFENVSEQPLTPEQTGNEQ